MKYPRVYRMLIAYGFSAFKAAEISLDAIRGDRYARQIAGIAFAARRPA